MFEKITTFLKNLVGEDNEISSSVDVAIKERLTSPFYGYFIFSWIIINWNFLYSLIFLDQEKVILKKELLKNEYLISILPRFWSWEHFLNFLIYPFLLTTFLVYVAPIITRRFFRQHIKNKMALKIIEIQETTQKKEEEKKLIKEEVQVIKQEVEKAKQKKKAEKESPEILWEEEFEDFKKHIIYNKLQQAVDIVYNNGGNTYKYNGARMQKIIDTDVLATIHTKGLVSIEGTSTSEQIRLTEKGKFFVSKFLESSK